MGILSDAKTLFPVITLTISVIVNAIFGLIVLTRTYRKNYGWYFAATIFGIVMWSLGDLFMLIVRVQRDVRIWAELFYIGPMFIPVFIWFFATSFPDNRRLRPWQVTLALALSLPMAITFLFDRNFFVRSIMITNTLNIASPRMPGFLLYSSFFSLFFMLAYVSFWMRIRSLRGTAKTQVAYTFYAAFVGSVAALITNLLLPTIGTKTVIWVGPIFSLIFASAVTTAIIKHRLFDIRWYTVRSTAYVLAVVTAATLYVIPAVLLSTYLLHVSLRLSTVLLLVVITLIVAFLFGSLKKFFDRITNRFFYQDAYDPQVFISALNRALVSTINLDKLLADAAQIIQNNVKTEYCVIGVIETKFRGLRVIGTTEKTFRPQDIETVRHLTPKFHGTVIVTDNLGQDDLTLRRILTDNNIAILVRITSSSSENHEGVGYITLGPKKSGNPYSEKDAEVLDIVSRELFIAIQNALHFEEIQQFNVTLQQRVEEATRKLRHSNEKLRNLDQTKDDFISMASHQLRTPLTSVKGYVSMVLDGDAGPINPMQRKLLNQSFISSQRMVYLIADLLNISRLKTGKFVIEPSPTNLAQITKDEISQLVGTAKSRGLTLTYDKPQDFPTYMLDTVKTRQVIMNFVDNAIYYTPSGGHIHVELRDTPKTIELKVVDDGIGVPKHLQHHLFTKFYRAPNAQKARPDGTGLGLFMARKVIAGQGGAIIFRSIEGKGSVFGFSFAKSHLAVPPTDSTTHAM